MKILKNTEIISNNILYANTPIKRLIGLLGRTSFNDIDGLLLTPCSQIHSIGMRFVFDAIYLDKNNKIIALFENISHNRILPYKLNAKSVLELPKGSIIEKNLKIGDILDIIKE